MALGGLLQLKDHEIRLTTSGPKTHQLTLLVKGFVVVDASARPVGNVPRPIEDVPQSRSLLTQLYHQWHKSDATKSKDTSTSHSSPVTSSMNSPISGVKTITHNKLQINPQPLASQAPSKHLSESPTGKQFQPATNSSLHRNPNGTSYGYSTLHRERQASMSNERLIALIAKKKTETLPTHKTSEDATGNDLMERKSAEVSPRKGFESTANPSREASMTTNLRSEHSPAAHDPLVDELRHGDESRMPSQTMYLPVEGTQDQDRMARLGTSDEYAEQNPPTPPSTKESRPASPLRLRRPRSSKLSIRDIKISKEQETLLARPDCKYPKL